MTRWSDYLEGISLVRLGHEGQVFLGRVLVPGREDGVFPVGDLE